MVPSILLTKYFCYFIALLQWIGSISFLRLIIADNNKTSYNYMKLKSKNK